jgi:hypothetical protein
VPGTQRQVRGHASLGISHVAMSLAGRVVSCVYQQDGVCGALGCVASGPQLTGCMKAGGSKTTEDIITESVFLGFAPSLLLVCYALVAH